MSLNPRQSREWNLGRARSERGLAFRAKSDDCSRTWGWSRSVVLIVDMHVPARDRNGKLRDPRRVLDEARAALLDGVLVVGERDEVAARKAWLAARRRDDPVVFFGELVATPRERLICIPREPETVLLTDSFRDSLSDAPGAAEQVITSAKRQRAAVVVASPYEADGGQTAGDRIFALNGIDAVEVRTSATDELAADLALEAGVGMRKPCVSGSGAIDGGKAEMGWCATVFAREVKDQAALVDALLEGEAWPIMVDRSKPRDQEKGGSRGGGQRRRRRR